MFRVQAVLIRGVEFNQNRFIGRDNVGIVAILEVTQGKEAIRRPVAYCGGNYRAMSSNSSTFFFYHVLRAIKEKGLRGHDTHPVQPTKRHGQDRPAKDASRIGTATH